MTIRGDHINPIRKRILFSSLYFSEGAPIGYLWLALPTRLRDSGLPVEQITWLTAVLVLPWTFKFLWAPLVDAFHGTRWTLRHWIVVSQILMGATLLPLLWLDPISQFSGMAACLILHAFVAATQDVSIDAWCIATTDIGERGRLNGWMQAGMLLGRACMGGGALVLSTYIGDRSVVLVLIALIWCSMLMVIVHARSPAPQPPPLGGSQSPIDASMGEGEPRRSIRWRPARSTWFALAFAATGAAVFKSLEVVYGPFLIDRGIKKQTIGWFSMGPMIGSMIIGSLLGGWLADRWGRRHCVAGSLLFIVLAVAGLALTDLSGQATPASLLVWLAAAALGIGMFTSSSYAMYMDLAEPATAATQFSAFMGATNGCESWSSYAAGQLIKTRGYPSALLWMCAASIVSLPILWGLRRRHESEGTRREE
ncbi:MAG: MFS transporter [Planctomycetales bacterium]|nr:MFS transporter [Planctomycetales bacterium]